MVGKDLFEPSSSGRAFRKQSEAAAAGEAYLKYTEIHIKVCESSVVFKGIPQGSIFGLFIFTLDTVELIHSLIFKIHYYNFLKNMQITLLLVVSVPDQKRANFK